MRTFRSGRFLTVSAAVAIAASSLVAVAFEAGTASGSVRSAESTAHNTPTGGYGVLPAESGSPSAGGTISYAETPGSPPTYILPIVPSADASVFNDYQFQYQMYLPLYWSPTGISETVSYPLSLATAPVFSNGDKTVTIHMDTTWKWSNGQSVDANDLLFFISLVKAAVKANASNWNNYSPGFFPDNVVSASAPSKFTVVLNLDKAYNPGYYFDDQLDLPIPLPSTAWDHDVTGGPAVNWAVPANALKIYNYLNAQSKDLGTWATNPLWKVVDGPFVISTFDAGTSQASFTANPSYSGTKAHISKLEFLPFTSYTAEVAQLRAGKLDVGIIDEPDLPQVSAIKSMGYNVFGYPDWGWQYLLFNFKDKTGGWSSIIGQLYVRQALAHLVDQPGIITGIFKNAAGPDYGPVPEAPSSPYAPANATSNPYPYSLSDAANLLKSHGWKVVPGGSSTCTDPGTASNQCGAGIAKGASINFTVYYTNQPTYWATTDTAIASAAAQIGITIHVVPKEFNYLLQNYNDPSAPANVNKWQAEDFGGFTQSLYPTTNTIFNTTGVYNIGGYSSTKADSLIQTSVFGGNASAVKNEISYLDANLPALFLPNPDLIYAWKDTISGPPASFSILTQYYALASEWYYKK